MSGEEYRRQRDLLNWAEQQQAAQAQQGAAQQAAMEPYGESSYIKYVGDMARGQGGPSAAQIQASQNLAQAIAQSRGMAAAQRGINPALAARQAAMGQAGLAQQGATEAAKLRAAEQLGALGAWGEQVSGKRAAAAQLESARISGQMAKDIEASRGQRSMFGGLLGGVAGAFIGGPAGAAAGASIGSQMAYGGEIPESQMNLKPTHDNQGCYACGGPVRHMAAGGMPMLEAGGSTVRPPLPPPSKMPAYGAALSSVGKALQKDYGSSDPNAIIQSTLGYGYGGAVNMTGGGKVPGQAQYAGDTLANDTVPAMLSPKEIVIPRSIALADDAGDKAKAFVEAIRSKYSEGKKAY